MRAAVTKDGWGCSKKAYMKFDVFINAHRVQKCIAVDDELGIVLFHVTDDKGECCLNEEKMETVKQCAYGNVNIIQNESSKVW